MNQHSADLPVGTYPDPLPPILVSCDGPRSLFLIVRVGQDQHICIQPGFSLTLSNVALNITAYQLDIREVNVRLEKSDNGKGLLLTTLRPMKFEQISFSLDLLPCEEELGVEPTNHRIRVEAIPCKGAKLATFDLMNAFELHFLGTTKPLPHFEADDEESYEENDDACEEEICKSQ